MATLLPTFSQASCVSCWGNWMDGSAAISTSFVPLTGPEVESGPVVSRWEDADSDVAIFDEDGGYGVLTTARLDRFAWNALNLAFDPPSTPEPVGIGTIDFTQHLLEPFIAIPESGSVLIGCLGILPLLQRRRS